MVSRKFAVDVLRYNPSGQPDWVRLDWLPPMGIQQAYEIGLSYCTELGFLAYKVVPLWDESPYGT